MYQIAVIDHVKETAQQIRAMKLWEERKDMCLKSIICDEENGINALEEENIDIVLLVSNKRKAREIKLLRDIKNNLVDIYVILISDLSDYDNIREGFIQGVFDYLLRPLTENSLNTSLNRIYDNFGYKYIREKIVSKLDVLIDNIFLGSDHVKYICQDIINFIYYDLNDNEINGKFATDKAKEKVYEEMIKRKPWLEKFTWGKVYAYKNGIRIKTREQVIKEWQRDFLEAALVVRKYQMLDNKLIYSIGKYVVVHVDERLTLESVSNGVFLNKCYISHIFKKVAGISFVDFMTDVKIDRAKILLLDEERKIYDIAATIGYSDGEYFCKIFKKATGITPSEYREKLKT